MLLPHGAGFDFGAGSFFAGPSVNVPYGNLGADWLFGTGLKPYVMIHTIGKHDKPTGSTTTTTTTLSCPAGFILVGNACQPDVN